MTPLDHQRLMILGAISQLPPVQRERVKAAADDIRRTVETNGELGQLALGIVGVEYAIGHEAGAT